MTGGPRGVILNPMKTPPFTRLAALTAGLFLLAAFSLSAQDAGQPTTDAPAGDTTAPQTEVDPGAENPPMALPGADTPQVVYQPNFLGAPVPLDLHRASGYIIGGLYAGAAVVGLIRYNDLVNGAASAAYLKYVHIALFGTGELFYAFNAITGISMIPKTGGDTKIGTLHRAAFFVHVVLLAGQMVMGIFESNAVENGDMVTVKNLGLAHAIVGIAIPVIELTSGILTNFPDLLGK